MKALATNQSIRIIDYVTRLNNSVNGNPRYRVHFTDGSSALTKSDSSCSYEVENLTHSRYKGRELIIGWTRAGRIETIERMEEGHSTELGPEDMDEDRNPANW